MTFLKQVRALQVRFLVNWHEIPTNNEAVSDAPCFQVLLGLAHGASWNKGIQKSVSKNGVAREGLPTPILEKQFSDHNKVCLIGDMQQLLTRTYYIHFIVPKIISNLGVAPFHLGKLPSQSNTDIYSSRGLRRGTEDAKHLWSAQAEERGV